MTMTGFKLPAAHRSGATANGNVLRRKCNCGGKSSGGGDCDECKKKKETQLGIQKKLKIGASNDPLELEADRMADLVLRKPEPQPAAGKRSSGSSTHRQIQRQSTTAVGPASLSGDASSVISKVGTASPLPAGVRSDFENRFGRTSVTFGSIPETMHPNPQNRFRPKPTRWVHILFLATVNLHPTP